MVESTGKIVLKPIGVVHTKASDNQVKEEHREVEAVVDVFPEFAEALERLRRLFTPFHFVLPAQVEA
jgi:tRNA (Thr-GGU) A37 N-methylase